MSHHQVYFIGGPLDLAKQVRRGETPGPTLTMSEIEEPVAPIDFRLQQGAMRPVRHVYTLHELPRPDPRTKERLFAALYVGREQA